VIKYRYTSHQIARGARPDAVSGTKWYLTKNLSELRLTYQIRLLTFLAGERGVRLIVRLPKSSRISRDLRTFVKENSTVVKIEKVD
jgi:hypothetical protein